MQQTRQLIVAAAKGYKTRTETFNDREYLVVPVVALVEGVVHAMNASNAEFVAAEEFSRAPQGWNGRPLFYGHPIVSGKPVSGNTPDVLEQKSIGLVFNTGLKKKKLTMEAWIDVLKAAEVAPDLIERVKADDSIEISVGVFVETDDSEGTYEGKKYLGAWHDIVPDHLALLPKGDEGACSVDMGCGVRAAQKQEAVVANEKPARKPSIMGKFLQMFRAAQPANEMSNTDLTRKLYEALRVQVSNVNYVEAFLPVTDPNRVVYSVYEPAIEAGMGYPYTRYALHERQFTLDANGVVTIGDAVIEVEPVLSYEPVLMAEEPAASEGDPVVAKGARNSKSDQEKIQAMHNHAVALGAYCDPKMAAAPKTASGSPCACGGHVEPTVNSSENEKEKIMTKEQIVKFLETATEEQMKALSVAAGEKPAAETPAAAAPAAVVATPAAAQPAAAAVEVKEPTLADLMAKATPEVKAQYEANLKTASDKKDATVKALKDTGRCTISDEALKAKSQEELDQIVALAGVQPARGVDFGGQGSPKDLSTGNKDEVAAPVDMNARILAKRKK